MKKAIQVQFNLASRSYDSVAYIQKKSAQLLVTYLQKVASGFYPKTILDLGTGTGYVSEMLLPFYSHSIFMLNDIAPGMINKAKEKFSHYCTFNFCVNDMEYSEFDNYDLIISNFSFQWLNQLEQTLQKFYSQSKLFAFSCLLDGTFKEWEQILKNYALPTPLHNYPTEQKLNKFLLMLGNHTQFFKVKKFRLSFDNPRIFMDYLKKLGATATTNHLPLQKIKNLIAAHNHNFSVTYNVFFGIIKRI